jgi:glutamate carboxypeptidase
VARGLAGALAEWCAARQDEMVALLRELVDTPSHASDREGVAKVARLVCEPLEQIDFSFEEHPTTLPTHLAWLEPIMSPGVPSRQLAGSWVGRRTARESGRLLLLGDLDTAWPPGRDGAHFSVRDGRARGPGVADMKGGLLVLVTALRALHALGAATPGVSVVLAGDEQAGSFGSRQLVETEARKADWCLCVECARDGGQLMHARGHIGVGRVEVTGIEAHAGSARSAGASAIAALAGIVPRLDALTRRGRGIYVTVTLIGGGRRRSVVPGSAWATLDVRTPDASAWAETTEQIERVVARAQSPGVTLGLKLHAHRPGFGLGSGGAQLLDEARAAGRLLGIRVRSQASPAAGSSAFAGALGVPTLDGLGPSGGALMTPAEYVEIDSLAPRAALLALLVHRLASAGRAKRPRA